MTVEEVASNLRERGFARIGNKTIHFNNGWRTFTFETPPTPEDVKSISFYTQKLRELIKEQEVYATNR